jgi:hypothetical protein
MRKSTSWSSVAHAELREDAVDFDPTTNLNLPEELWQKLLLKIKQETYL